VKRLLNHLSAVKYIGCYVALAGLVVSVTFSFVVYPIITDPYHVVLDPDHYGALGFGLWQYGALSYFPDDQPTLNRGPIYPLLIAFLLTATDGWWPYSIQVAQSALFGLTCFMVFWMSKNLWNNKVALLTSALCTLHPFLIWYTSRIWIETLATFLFTALIASLLFLSLKPTSLRSVMVGLILGIAALCKSTFLPFIVIVPLLLGCLKERIVGWRSISYIFLTGLILVLPWSIRNYSLANEIVPVHLLAGYNFQRGDSFVENYTKSPFSYLDLWDLGTEKIYSLVLDISQQPEHSQSESLSDIERIGALDPRFLPQLPRPEREILSDSIFLRQSIARYVENPGFFVRKLILNAWMFWTLGETKQKTVVISLFQIPLLALFIFSSSRMLKQKGIRTVQGIHISLILLYYLFHLPIFAFARLSVVLIPAMLTYALGILDPVLKGPSVAPSGGEI
jgi:4-amino-4-deoxy-L-arabinose transferase-like glycosyltransferase